MLHGEYESMSLINQTVPTFSPKPIAWGKCKNHDRHFLLFSFHAIHKGLPSIPRFTYAVAQLHTSSVDANPTGKFGFHVTTYNGTLPQDNTWADTWEEFYIRGMKRMLRLEKEARGPSDELEQLSGPFLEKVIPRLIRPMETGGRRIKPVLIHGDLWLGNVSTQDGSDNPLMYDSSAFWGHNECKNNLHQSLSIHLSPPTIQSANNVDELGIMRPLEDDWSRECMESYHRHIPKSEPQDDWDARNVLYAM